MAELIVDALEIVDVENRDMQRFFLVATILGELGKLFGQKAPILCAGQVVLHR